MPDQDPTQLPKPESIRDYPEFLSIKNADWFANLSDVERSHLLIFFDKLKSGESFDAANWRDSVPLEVFTKPEVLDFLEKTLSREVDNFNKVVSVLVHVGKKAKSILIDRPDLRQAVKKSVVSLLQQGLLGYNPLVKVFNIEVNEEIQEMVIRAIKERLAELNFDMEPISAIKISLNDWKIPFEKFRDFPEVRKIIKARIIRALTTVNRDVNYAHELAQGFVRELGLDPQLVQEAGKEGIIKLGKTNTLTSFVNIARVFGLSDEDKQSPEVQSAVLENLGFAMIESKNIAFSIVNEFKIPEEKKKEAATEAVRTQLAKRNWKSATNLAESYEIGADKLSNMASRNMLTENLKNLIIGINGVHDSRDFGEVEYNKFIGIFRISDEEKNHAAQRAVKMMLQDAIFGSAIRIVNRYKVSHDFLRSDDGQLFLRIGIVKRLQRIVLEPNQQEEEEDVQALKDICGVTDSIDEYYPQVVRDICAKFELNNLTELEVFIKENKAYFQIVKESGVGPILTKKDIPRVRSFHIGLIEAEILLREGYKLDDLENGEARFKALTEHVSEWRDQNNVVIPFKNLGESFGYDRMFAYIDRPDLSLHDALHRGYQVESIFRESTLTPDQFYGNILFQVMKDDAQYDDGTAHHKLNAIADTFPVSIEAVLGKASEYSEIELLRELADTFRSRKDIFASWKNLKRFHELSQILERAEILDQLKELSHKGKQAVYHFVETLAFHPNSSVDMQAAVMFLEDPARFFDIEEIHSSESHEKKKPSNYTQIPNLDLTAEELRDALVEGPLDRLQVFSPMTIEYTFGGTEKLESPESLREMYQKAIGSRQKGIAGQAKNSKKLFSELQKLLIARNLEALLWLLGQADIPDDPELKKELEALLFHKDFGLAVAKPKSEPEMTYVLKINRKSDPDGVLAGNDTACCMPFGSGKNNVYMANPDTSLFTIQMKRPDGTVRTIAQSVLTKDIDIGKAIPEIIQELNETGKHIDQVIPEQILARHKSVIACDNIEVNPNYKDPESLVRIAQIYKDFFAEYLKRQKEAYDRRVVIGTGYSDLDVPLEEETNTFAPKAPVGYSDKTGPKVFVIDTEKESPALKKKIITEPEIKPAPDEEGIAPLTFEDTLPVSYIEGKAYSDNESLMTYLHNMENGLIAKDINNTAKGRPNLSFKYIDDSGRMRGYIFAYEGKALVDDSERSVIYISDLASDKQSRLAGGRLIRAFVEAYKINYLEKGNNIAILTEAREGTSFKIIQRQIDNIARELGIEFEVKEIDQEEKGGEMMHRVLISPKVATA